MKDFEVLLGQCYDELHQELPKILLVTGEPVEDFVAWVSDDCPDWDRYEYESAQAAIERKLMPRKAYMEENGVNGKPLWWDRFSEVTKRELDEAGYQRYIQNLVKEIKMSPRNIPPLVRMQGKPADGRHRTLALMKMDRKVAPVIRIGDKS